MIQTAIALMSTAEASKFLANENMNMHRQLKAGDKDDDWSYFNPWSWFGEGKKKDCDEIRKQFSEFFGESSNETIEELYSEIPLGADSQITADTFVQWAMNDAGLELDEVDSDDISESLTNTFDYADKNKDGTVGLDEFMCMVRGRMSHERKKKIEKAYPGEPGWFSWYDFDLESLNKTIQRQYRKLDDDVRRQRDRNNRRDGERGRGGNGGREEGGRDGEGRGGNGGERGPPRDGERGPDGSGDQGPPDEIRAEPDSGDRGRDGRKGPHHGGKPEHRFDMPEGLEEAIREINESNRGRDDGIVSFYEWENHFKQISCQHQDDEAFFAEFDNWDFKEAYME